MKNIWFANEPVANQFITNLVENINNYSGENWIDMYPEKF